MGQSSGEVIAITIVFTIVQLSFSGLRLWARRITGVKGGGMGIDDALAFLAAASRHFRDIEVVLSDEQ